MIRQKKVDTENKDIVVGMLQSMSMRDYDPKVFNEFGLVIFDECFIRREMVLTESGPIMIGQLYDMWTNNEPIPLIKSFNEKTNRFEYKKMTHAWEKKSSKLIKLNIMNHEIICTTKHKFLTMNNHKYKYVEAHNLTYDDMMVSHINGKLNLSKINNIYTDYTNLEYVYDIEVSDNHNFIVQTNNNDGIVVHNCHHLGARVFSQAMQKTGGHYTIGLSATPTRADGLTKVIEWYLGPMLYKLERKGEKNVSVKLINYNTDNNQLFVEKKQWMKGKIAASVPKMITNIGLIDTRNKLIVDIIGHLRNINDRKILVLSNRIAHLEYLKKETDKQIAQDILAGNLEEDEIKTAFYIGKCKSYELIDAEGADIIFGSYAMAEEGLDIDKLNTLVLATPKKNIVQSIGRILRKPIKDGDTKPLIVDIADGFSVFINWGNIRQQYYNTNQYTIDTYMAQDDKCISMTDYLIKNKAIKPNQKDINLRKEYMCHKYGTEAWELDQDLLSDDAEIDEAEEQKYNYNPDLKLVLEVDQEIDYSKSYKHIEDQLLKNLKP
jgi:superfamily II DNA or RNA helicase